MNKTVSVHQHWVRIEPSDRSFSIYVMDKKDSIADETEDYDDGIIWVGIDLWPKLLEAMKCAPADISARHSIYSYRLTF